MLRENEKAALLKLKEDVQSQCSVIDFRLYGSYGVNLEHDCFISVVLFSREEIEHGPLAESPPYKMIEKEAVKM